MTAHLFVYGTLLSESGHPMQAVLRRGGTLVGPGRVRGRLYDFGSFPGLVRSDRPEGWVSGEVYRLERPDVTLPPLDAYEGCGPEAGPGSGFRRVREAVRLVHGGEIEAWVYRYEGDLRGARPLPPGDAWRIPAPGGDRHGPRD
jgi:gamma-glutamylcyclotransferase (GGCT)/AIG2-like uncharacterized protein YtfP